MTTSQNNPETAMEICSVAVIRVANADRNTLALLFDGRDFGRLKSQVIRCEGGGTNPDGLTAQKPIQLIDGVISHIAVPENEYLGNSGTTDKYGHSLVDMHPKGGRRNLPFRTGDLTIGDFEPGLMGDGAHIDERGNGEMRSLRLHEFLEVPELRFNRIDVVSGEAWNAIAFGTIDSVDTESRIASLHLEQGEWGGLHVGDFCRGIFHNLTSQSEDLDDCGFQQIKGFWTSYFTPTEIIESSAGRFVFKYNLRTPETPHPAIAMKFVVYGHPTDTNRQKSAYSTRTYTRYLAGVNIWEIKGNNIAAQFGDLSNLSTYGLELSGYSSYQQNVYFSGNIQFTGDYLQDEILKNSPYQVGLSIYSTTLRYNNGVWVGDNSDVATSSDEGSVQSGANPVTADSYITWSGIEIFKGQRPLYQSSTPKEWCYVIKEIYALNCTCEVNSGAIGIKTIDEKVERASVEIVIECEGKMIFRRKFSMSLVTDGSEGSVGASTRWTDWMAGVKYYDGETPSDEYQNVKYHDYVTLDNSKIVAAYQCIETHVSTSDFDATKWKSISYLPPVATKLILAERALIKNLIAEELSTTPDLTGIEINRNGSNRIEIHDKNQRLCSTFSGQNVPTISDLTGGGTGGSTNVFFRTNESVSKELLDSKMEVITGSVVTLNIINLNLYFTHTSTENAHSDFASITLRTNSNQTLYSGSIDEFNSVILETNKTISFTAESREVYLIMETHMSCQYDEPDYIAYAEINGTLSWLHDPDVLLTHYGDNGVMQMNRMNSFFTWQKDESGDLFMQFQANDKFGFRQRADGTFQVLNNGVWKNVLTE